MTDDARVRANPPLLDRAASWLIRGLLLGASMIGCSVEPLIASDWRIDACFASQPGVTVLEVFDVEHVSELFPRMKPWDKARIGPGTDERPASVVRMRGTLKIVQPAVGPLVGHTFEQDDPTCLLVLDADGSFPEGEVPLYLGPISGS